MRIYGQFGTTVRIFKCFGLLINDGSVASVSYASEDSTFRPLITNHALLQTDAYW